MERLRTLLPAIKSSVYVCVCVRARVCVCVCVCATIDTGAVRRRGLRVSDL